MSDSFELYRKNGYIGFLGWFIALITLILKKK